MNELELVQKELELAKKELEIAKRELVLATNGKGNGKAKGGVNRQPKRVMDTHTGLVYPALNQAASAVASEYGLDPDNHWAWYSIPDRKGRFLVSPTDEQIAEVKALLEPEETPVA